MYIFPKSLTRDNYFKDYQDITDAALSNVASVFDNILHDHVINIIIILNRPR